MEDTLDRIDADSPFYNRWINIGEIPTADDEEFKPLDREYLYIRLARVLLSSLFGAVFIVVLILILGQSFKINLLILSLYGLWVLFRIFISVMGFRYMGYSIREHDIGYRYGYIIRHRQYIPFRRVQHCKMSEGLIERLFDFATVVVSAAGDDIVIPGLKRQDALNLQQWINEKVDQLTKEMKYDRE